MGPSAHMVLAQRRQKRLILTALCVNPGTFYALSQLPPASQKESVNGRESKTSRVITCVIHTHTHTVTHSSTQTEMV